MNKRTVLLAAAVLLIVGLTGCGSPEFVSGTPANGTTGVPVTTGQGVNFSTNTITATFNVDMQIKVDSAATIDPVPIAVSSAAAHDGKLSIAILGYDSETAYLYYSMYYKLTAATEHTVTIENIWNELEFMGMSNRSASATFKFTTE